MNTMGLLERAQKGDKAAREQLITENVGLVFCIAKRYLGRYQEADDLCQIGMIGLMKAIDKFDTKYEVKFSTYAVPMINGEIKRFLRDDGMVKVSRSVKENGWKVNRAEKELVGKLGREVTTEELAEAAGLSLEDTVLAMEANHDVESLYKSVSQNDGNELFLLDQVVAGGVCRGVGCTAIDSRDEEKEALLDRLMLKQALSELSKEEQQFIKLRFFDDKTQSEIAKQFGVSQVQISRMEKRLLLRMRHMILQDKPGNIGVNC